MSIFVLLHFFIIIIVTTVSLAQASIPVSTQEINEEDFPIDKPNFKARNFQNFLGELLYRVYARSSNNKESRRTPNVICARDFLSAEFSISASERKWMDFKQIQNTLQ